MRTLPLRRESECGDRALKRILDLTGGITSGIFQLMTNLAIAAIESGEERVASGELEDSRVAGAMLGEAV